MNDNADRIELSGGTIVGGSDDGNTVYFVSLSKDGAEMPLWDGPSYGAALLQGQLCSAVFELPLVNTAEAQADG